ncbi:MAG: DUF4157 domain-containing protein [Ignavibacteria bacterium]|nr:DUF4157 domain-containing protein [Ignavibacteria bacterium]
MADKVMRMPINKNKNTFSNPAVLRPFKGKCAECDEEEKLHRKENSNVEFEASDELQNYTGSMNSGGNYLSKGTRSFFEPRFGYDFSKVKIHNDSIAAKSAQSINALAYTSGNNIVFNQNQYSPETDRGKRLFAHELTHVVQQSSFSNINSVHNIQRKPDDKHDLTSIDLKGDAILEKTFDNEALIGKFSNSKGTHVGKIQEGLIRLGIDLPIFGADEKYGSETEKGVKDFQKRTGMRGRELDGIVGRKTLGLLDRSLRNNAISTDELTEDDLKLEDKDKVAKDEACKGKPSDEKCPVPNNKVIKGASEAVERIDKVIAEQLPPVKNDKADYPVIFSQLFRNNDTRPVTETSEEVKNNFLTIREFINNLKTSPSHVRCGTDCDGGCRSKAPAYHSRAGGAHIITFCPSFEKNPERISIVIHECHHASIKDSKDIAYQHSRLIEKLDHTEALRNAASFHLYAALVENPGSDFIGPKVKDTNMISDASHGKNVDLSLAFVQQWCSLVTFDMSNVSRDMEEARLKGSYSPKASVDLINDVYAKWFGVTPAPSKPKKLDLMKAKAIEERSIKMSDVFDKPFLITKSLTESKWERGPGNNIQLNDQLLRLDVNHMVIALLQELVHATKDISAESEPLYVGTINDIRNTRGLAP